MEEEKEYKFANIDGFIRAMYQLSPNSNPGKYIADYANLERIKEDIVNKFFDLFVGVSKKCPHISISAEGRLKTYPSYLEKVYKKEKENLEKGIEQEPIIYDMFAFRMIVVSITDSLEQVTSSPNKRTGQLEYFYRVKDKENVTQTKIKKINIGDAIHINANTSIKVSQDNMITNPDGSISIRNEVGDSFILTGKTIEKDDRSSTMNAVYEVRAALEEYTKQNGFEYISIRDKDRIAHPKTKKEAHIFKSPKYTKEFIIDLLTEINKIDLSLMDKNFTQKIIENVRQQQQGQQEIEKIRQTKNEHLNFLKQNPAKRNYKRDAYLPEYQSYHLGYFDPNNGYPFEIQLRSLYMHRIAEHNSLIGHNSYKELEIDDSAPLRVPFTFVFKKSCDSNGKFFFEKDYIQDDILYKKMYGKTKEEVFAEIARKKLPKISLAKPEKTMPKEKIEDQEL